MTRDEINKKFPNELSIIKYFERIRWGYKPKCAYCGSTELSKRTIDFRFKCYHCNKTSSVTVGTLLHGTNLDLRYWLIAFATISNAKKGVTVRQIKKDLPWINSSTAWKIFNKIRHLMDIELSDNLVIAQIFEKIPPWKVKKRLNSKYVIPKCIRLKSKNEPVLNILEAKANIRFKKVMAYIAKYYYFTLWMYGVSKDEIDSLWRIIERQISALHNPIELKYLGKYILEAIFEITPIKDAGIFETLVKNSMRQR